MYYIGYDLGSSFVKIALLDFNTNKQVALIKEPSSEMEIISLKDNWAEQDPKLWWKYICNGTKKLINKTNINRDFIKAIGISYQMHGLVLLDNKKKLIRNSISELSKFRISEGASLEKDLLKQIQSINALLEKVSSFESERISIVKTRIKKNLEI